MSKKLALLLSSLLIALLLAEVGLRLSGYDINSHPHWKFHPRLGWVVDPQKSGLDSVQPSGFRHSALTVPKPQGVRRLLVLGDSFGLGTAFAYAQTFPGLLQERLSQTSGHSWQVVNLSVDDWGSAQQLIALQEFGLAHEPDVVVLQAFPFNDLCNNERLLAFTCSLQDLHRPYFVLDKGQLELTRLHPWRNALTSRLRLFGLLENSLDRRQGGPELEGIENPDQVMRSFFQENARRQGFEYEGAVYAVVPHELQPPRIRRSWQLTEAIYARISELLKEKNIPLLALVVPFSFTFEGQQWDELQRLIPAPMIPDADSRRLEPFLKGLGAAVVPIRRLIETSGRPPGDFFISAQDGHFGVYGHARVAEWILDELLRQGVARQR